MGHIIHLSMKEGGFLLVFFRLFGFGIQSHQDEKEHSISITLKIWRLNTFLTFALI